MHIKHYRLHDGSTMYYEAHGHGEPLILLHGNGGSTAYFKHQIRYFKKYFTVYAIDSRGRGNSTDQAENISFQLMVKDLYEIIKQEKLTKVHLLGFSDGANLALKFAETYPELIDSLVLNAPNESFDDLTPFAQWRFKAFDKLLQAGAKFHNSLKKSKHYFKLAFTNLHLNYSKLAKMHFPVLILVGQFDIVKESFSKKLAKTFPNSKLIIEPWTGHAFAIEHPLAYNKYILNFLQNKSELT